MEGIKIDTILQWLIAIISFLILLLLSGFCWYLVQLWNNQKELYNSQKETNKLLNTMHGEHNSNHKKGS